MVSNYMNSFVDEVVLIKVAQESARDNVSGRDPVSGKEIGKFFRNAAIGAGAFGLGAGTAGLVLNKGLPKVLQNLKPHQRAALIGGAGLISAGGSLAFRKAMKRNKELIRN